MRLERPGIGKAIAGVAAASIATGPTVILWLQILDMLLGETGFNEAMAAAALASLAAAR